VAVLRAGNTIICLQKKRTGVRASTHTEETLHCERRWTSVHLDIHVDDLEAAPGRALDAGARQEGEGIQQCQARSAAFCSDPLLWLLSHTEKPIAKWH